MGLELLLPVCRRRGKSLATVFGIALAVSLLSVSGCNGLAFSVTNNAGAGKLPVGQPARTIDKGPALGGPVVVFAGTGQKGFSDGAGTAAAFDDPTGLAIDQAGNIYVADSGNNAVRKISPTGDVTTLAGGTAGMGDGAGRSAQFKAPQALATDAMGNVYVSDSGNSLLRKIDADGTVSTLKADGGGVSSTGKTGTLLSPTGIAVDPLGQTVYVADSGHSRVLALQLDDRIISNSQVVADGGASKETPLGVALDSAGNLFISMTGTKNGVWEAPRSGKATLVADQGPGGASWVPVGLVIDPDGSVLVTDGSSSQGGVSLLSDGKVLNFADAFNLANAALGQLGQLLNGATGGKNAVQSLPGARLVQDARQGTSGGQAAAPRGIVADAAGNHYVADPDAHVIRKILASTSGQGAPAPAPSQGSGATPRPASSTSSAPSPTPDPYASAWKVSLDFSKVPDVQYRQDGIPVVSLNAPPDDGSAPGYPFHTSFELGSVTTLARPGVQPFHYTDSEVLDRSGGVDANGQTPRLGPHWVDAVHDCPGFDGLTTQNEALGLWPAGKPVLWCCNELDYSVSADKGTLSILPGAKSGLYDVWVWTRLDSHCDTPIALKKQFVLRIKRETLLMISIGTAQ